MRKKTQICNDSEKCRTCLHSSQISGTSDRTVSICCIYILDKGKARGCPVGDDCDKYDPGEDVYRQPQPSGRRSWKPKPIKPYKKKGN